MSTQTKSKWYLLIIGVLLITNIAMLFFFFQHKNNVRKGGGRGDRGAMMKNFLQKDIGFSAPQLLQYDSLSKKNREKMKADFENLRTNKELQFKTLGQQAFSDTAITTMVNQSAEKQKLMEWQMLQHFSAIRKICTPEQQIKYDSLLYTIWNKKKNEGAKK